MTNLHHNHLADLQKSGLSAETIKQAGIHTVQPNQIKKLGFTLPPGLSSMYEIPYTGCDGFSRFRCFYEDGKTGPQYLQQKNTKPWLYMPRVSVANLPKNTDIYITWGEKKALKANQDGLICIGIGGIAGWNDGNGGLITDFDLIDLKHCIVHIVPDNDWQSPPTDKNSNDMKQSVNQLADAFCDHEVNVKIVILPNGPEKGLDDYLCTHSVADFTWLPEEVHKKESEVDIDSLIEKLNRKHAVINFSGRFFILEETIDPTFGHHKIQFSSAGDFKNLYANQFIMRPHPTTNNKMLKIYLADAWIHSPDRREYKGIIFEPLKDISGYYNLWQGFAVEPKAGDWSLMKEHITYIICQGHKDIARWILAWMSFIVQKPGEDLQGTCIVLKGEQGVGKGIFAREFGALFGGHYLHLNNMNQITGRFNAHLANKLFVFCDEALWDGNEKAAGVIKGLITEPTFPVEYKGKDIFHVKNHANFMIASNSSWVVPAGEKERRFCVLDVSSDKAGATDYFTALMEQMNNGGREAMLYDLLHLDIAGINLRIIPKTAALTDQTIRNLESIPKFWLHCLTNPDSIPKIKDDERFCVTKSQLYESYCEFCKGNGIKNVTPSNIFGKDIRKYCPGIQDRRLGKDGEKGTRPNLYILPPWDECRRQFEKKISMQGVFET